MIQSFENVIELPSPEQRDASAKADQERRRICALIESQADGWRNEVERWLSETSPKRSGHVEAEHLRHPATRAVHKYILSEEKPEIVSTGFHDLDELMSLEPQSLVVLGARSGRGKSSLSLQMALHVAIHGPGPSLYFSSEMSSEQLALRAMCLEASVDSKRVRRKTYTNEEYHRMLDAAGKIARSLAWISDEKGLDVLRLKERSRREARRIEQECGKRPRLIVVDYLQRIRAGKAAASGANREQQVAAIAFELKELARELDLCVLVPAQLNAEGDKRGDDSRPRASDLRESKGIENEADSVLLIHNPHYESRTTDTTRDLSLGEACELIVAKGRSDGNGSAHVWFIPMFTQFRSMSDDEKYEQRAKQKREQGRR